jgi:TRAP-type mannitol/chloroaromatic compound transport system substrate-binding protein
MDRRRFITLTAAAGGTLSGLAAPAIAQSRPAVEWRCASGFTKALPTIFGAAELFADAVGKATGGRFTITVFEAGEASPESDPMVAVGARAVDMLHTAPHYFSDRDAAFAFGSGIPFGLNQRLTTAWLMEGGGLDLYNEFLAAWGIMAIPAGNTGAQMGGWFNREINSLDDLRGVRFRIGGFGGRILDRIGVVSQQVAPENLLRAFEAGEIDAAEFAGPSDDVALGLERVARYLYYPGWWEGGIALMNLINRESWNALTPEYQSIVRQASAYADTVTMARYDTLNPPVLAQLESAGTIIRPYSNDIMDACFTAAEQTYRDIAVENAAFAELLESYMAYRRSGYSWFRRSEYAYDTYLMILERGGRL